MSNQTETIDKLLQIDQKIDKELEQLQLSIRGNKLVISHQGITIGDVYQYNNKYYCMCFISQKWVNKISDWCSCCDYDCNDHNDIPRSIPFPNNGMEYEVPAIKFITGSECYLNEAVFKIWKCWKTTNQ